jgi:hypothetical protein
MSDSAIQLAGSSRHVFVAWQSLKRSARGPRSGGKRQELSGNNPGASGGPAPSSGID